MCRISFSDSEAFSHIGDGVCLSDLEVDARKVKASSKDCQCHTSEGSVHSDLPVRQFRTIKEGFNRSHIKISEDCQ